MADDWKITPRLTFNLGVRHEFFGFPSEVNGKLAVFDYAAALASGNPQDGFVFASNFDPQSIPGVSDANLRIGSSKTLIPSDRNNLMPRVGFA